MSIDKPIVKTIVCLANSRKNGGLCVAGKELDGYAGWIRPVSVRKGEEVSREECRYENGEYPQLLDVIDVPLIKSNPQFHQRENWLLNPNFRWKKSGRMHWRDLGSLTDPVSPLWIDESSGRNDRIVPSLINVLNDSLRFVRVDKLNLLVSQHKYVRGKFWYNDKEYDISVTDTECERIYLKKPSGNYHIRNNFLTVSIGPPFNGYCYKFIAAVIPCNKTSGT